MPTDSHPRLWAAFATARITALRPGQSPPPVTMPIFLLIARLLESKGIATSSAADGRQQMDFARRTDLRQQPAGGEITVDRSRQAGHQFVVLSHVGHELRVCFFHRP